MRVAGTGLMPASGAIYDELTAVTRRAFVPKMVVQIYKAAPFLSILLRNAQRAAGGASQVTLPVQGASYVNWGWTDYSGAFQQPSVQAAAQVAQWNLSLGVVAIPLLGAESLVQRTEAVIPLIRARMTDAKTVSVQALASACLGTSGTNPLAVNGLLDAYDDGTSVATYGGLSRTTNAFWKSLKISSGIAPSRSTMIAQIMQCAYNAGGEAPDIVLMSMSDWTTLAADFLTQERFNTNPGSRYGKDDAVNAGFRCLMLGDTAVLADPFVPKGTAFLINTRYLAAYLSEDANFAFSGFHSLIANNQLGSVGVVITGLALCCSKPSSGSQLSNVTGGAF